MEKEHIYRDRERERAGGRQRERVTPEYLDATRESVELRSRPRDPFSTVLSSSSSCVQLVRVLPRRAFSRSLSRFARPPIYFHFFVVFACRWKGNHGALRVTGPAVFFSSREDQPPTSITPIVAFSSRSLSLLPSSSFILRTFHSCQAQPSSGRDPSSPRLVMTKSCTSVNRHPPLPVFSG